MKRRDQVLVVEDDADSCELVAMVLREAGYSVDLARDGVEALQVASRRRPDVIVSDLQMPKLNGLELARRVHAVDPDLPIILNTGLAETRNVITAAEGYGAVTCLEKPMSLDELLWTIERSLAVSRQKGRRPGPPPLL
jgi:DNA-binding NtrC family response regulator